MADAPMPPFNTATRRSCSAAARQPMRPSRIATRSVRKATAPIPRKNLDRIGATWAWAYQLLARPSIRAERAACSSIVTPDLIRGPCLRRSCGSRIKSGMTKRGCLNWGGERSPQARHVELVSASMTGPCIRRRVQGNGRPWTLKQVQGDDERDDAG